MRTQSVGLGIALVCGSAALALGQAVNSNIAVTSYAQGHGSAPCAATSPPGSTPGTTGCGGCYPEGIPPSDPTAALLDQLTKINPEWAPIADMIQTPDPRADLTPPPASAAVYMHGTVDLTKINIGGDFPGSHVTDDQNTFITLDLADGNRIATGNGGPPSCPGEGCNAIEMEWEIGKYPLFAWADEGDRVTALGRWIFDCGHPDADPMGKCSNNAARDCILDRDCVSPGTCTNPVPVFNYRAEMHPPKGVAVIRDKSIAAGHMNRTAPAIPATRADVYVNADGGGAGDTCDNTHRNDPNDILFTKRCFVNACSTTGRPCTVDKDCLGSETCNRTDPAGVLANINADDFEFDMALPDAPSVSSVLKVTTKNQPKPKGGIQPKAVLTLPTPGPNPILHVKVPMTQVLPNGKMPTVFAQSISAGWKDDLTSLYHTQVKLKSLTINNPLKSATPVIPRRCTNPAGGFTATACSTNLDCAAGTCANNPSKSCHFHKDCGKQIGGVCAGLSECLGGLTPGWNLFGEVNGDWIGFKKVDTIGAKAPFLAPPFVVPSPTPAIIPQNITFNEFVPGDGTGEIHIATTGASKNCLDTLYGTNTADDLTIYGLTTGGTCLGGAPMNPGRVEVTHAITNTGSLGAVTGATCVPSGTQPINTLVTCNTTSVGGDAGTCASHPTNLCVEDKDCAPGTCSVTNGACHSDGQCKHCSLTTTTFCGGNSDCPAGTCSNSPTTACHTAGDCPTGGSPTCNGSPETCVSGSETCNGFEPCTVTGGAFTITYTIQVKP